MEGVVVAVAQGSSADGSSQRGMGGRARLALALWLLATLVGGQWPVAGGQGGCAVTPRWALEWQAVERGEAVREDAWRHTSLAEWDACGPIQVAMVGGQAVLVTSTHDGDGPRLVMLSRTGALQWSSLDVTGPAEAGLAVPVGVHGGAPASLVWDGERWNILLEEAGEANVTVLPDGWLLATGWLQGGDLVDDRASTNALLVDQTLVSLLQAEDTSLWAERMEIRPLDGGDPTVLDLPDQLRMHNGTHLDVSERVANLRGTNGSAVFVEFIDSGDGSLVIGRWTSANWDGLPDDVGGAIWLASDDLTLTDGDRLVDAHGATVMGIKQVTWSQAASSNQWPVRGHSGGLVLRWVDPPSEVDDEARGSVVLPLLVGTGAVALLAFILLRAQR